MDNFVTEAVLELSSDEKKVNFEFLETPDIFFINLLKLL